MCAIAGVQHFCINFCSSCICFIVVVVLGLLLGFLIFFCWLGWFLRRKRRGITTTATTDGIILHTYCSGIYLNHWLASTSEPLAQRSDSSRTLAVLTYCHLSCEGMLALVRWVMNCFTFAKFDPISHQPCRSKSIVPSNSMLIITEVMFWEYAISCHTRIVYKETYFWCWTENRGYFLFLEQVNTRDVSEESKDIILELNCDAPSGSWLKMYMSVNQINLFNHFIPPRHLCFSSFCQTSITSKSINIQTGLHKKWF